MSVVRRVVLDTETTGLEVGQGHRVIEIGCVELLDRRRTERGFHVYLNPERAVDPGAVSVHGLTDAFLADKPRFGDVARAFVEFISGSELIIHNAPFDVGFIDAELARLGAEWPRIGTLCTVVDTLALARALHPGQRNSLEALCRRYGVDDSGRDFHGARLDAELLLQVWLAMTGGQAELLGGESRPAAVAARTARGPLRRPRVIAAAPAEREAHEARLARIEAASRGACLWRRREGGDA